MADETKPAEKPEETPAEKPAETAPVKTEEKPAAEPVATQQAAKTGKDFLTAFGQQGAVWFVEGKSWDEAQKFYTDSLKAENEALKTKLKGVEFGQKEGVSFAPAEGDPHAKQKSVLASRLGDNVARFAAGIVMPAASNN